MNDQRYASLSGNLLARKGAARPAMRPRPLTTSSMEDLGWDDMGFDTGHRQPGASSLSALTPAPRSQAARDELAQIAVHEQQQALAESFAQPEPAPAPPPAIKEVVDAIAPLTVDPAPESRDPDITEPDDAVAPPAVANVVKLPRRAAGTTGRKAAFTLRLDAERHLKLRLATAITGRSAQHLVTAALDQFIDTLPEVGSIALHLPARKGQSSERG